MQYYRCKCGNVQSWTTMGVPDCLGCSKCGSDLAQGPNAHAMPKAHDFSVICNVDTDEGPKPLSTCKYCHQTKKQTEQLGKKVPTTP
jgi:hypothetical protein